MASDTDNTERLGYVCVSSCVIVLGGGLLALGFRGCMRDYDTKQEAQKQQHERTMKHVERGDIRTDDGWISSDLFRK